MATALRMARDSATVFATCISAKLARGEHLPVSLLTMCAFQLVAPLIPADCAIIIESVVAPERMDGEIRKATDLFGRARTGTRSTALALELASC